MSSIDNYAQNMGDAGVGENRGRKNVSTVNSGGRGSQEDSKSSAPEREWPQHQRFPTPRPKQYNSNISEFNHWKRRHRRNRGRNNQRKNWYDSKGGVGRQEVRPVDQITSQPALYCNTIQNTGQAVLSVSNFLQQPHTSIQHPPVMAGYMTRNPGMVPAVPPSSQGENTRSVISVTEANPLLPPSLQSTGQRRFQNQLQPQNLMQQQAAMFSAMNVNQLQHNPYIATQMQMNPCIMTPGNYPNPYTVTTQLQMMAMQQNIQKQQLQAAAQNPQFVRTSNMMNAANPAQQFVVRPNATGQPQLMFMPGSIIAVPGQNPLSSRSRTPSLQNQSTPPNVTQTSKDNLSQPLRRGATSSYQSPLPQSVVTVPKAKVMKKKVAQLPPQPPPQPCVNPGYPPAVVPSNITKKNMANLSEDKRGFHSAQHQQNVLPEGSKPSFMKPKDSKKKVCQPGRYPWSCSPQSAPAEAPVSQDAKAKDCNSYSSNALMSSMKKIKKGEHCILALDENGNELEPLASDEEKTGNSPLIRMQLYKMAHELCPTIENQPPPIGRFVLFEPKYYSFARHIKNGISSELLAQWWKTILLHCDWLNPSTSERTIPRLVCWLTDEGCSCTYNYSGAVSTPVKKPQWLVDIGRVIMKILGWEGQLEDPSACNINLYRDGEDCVGWHADDENLFGGLVGNCLIMSLSLGQTRTFQMKLKDSHYEYNPPMSIRLDHGDICTMEGLMQRFYWHRVPPNVAESKPRINLTFRWIVNHRKTCPKSWEGSSTKSKSQAFLNSWKEPIIPRRVARTGRIYEGEDRAHSAASMTSNPDAPETGDERQEEDEVPDPVANIDDSSDPPAYESSDCEHIKYR